MTNEKRTHLIADEKLGGLLREYVETDRKAGRGDFVINNKGNEDEAIYLVTGYSEECVSSYNVDYTGKENDDEYTIAVSIDRSITLAPTDVIQYEGTRYKLVDRKAEVGEKVALTNPAFGYEEHPEIKVGNIYEVTAIEGDGDCTVVSLKDTKFRMYHSEYRVLGPIEETPLVELTSANASEQVIEMLANLSRRIVRLEDELDTLHRNNVKLAEELANHKAEEQAPAETTEVDAIDFNAFTEAVVDRVAAKLLGGNTGGASR